MNSAGIVENALPKNLKRKRPVCWSEKETLTLLELWEGSLGDLNRAKRNRRVHDEISKGLAMVGIMKTGIEVANKIKNLTTEYRKEKSKLASGGAPSQWRFFENINKIIGRLPRNTSSLAEESYTFVDIEPEIIIENEEIGNEEFSEEQPSEVFSSPPSTSTSTADDTISNKKRCNKLKKKMPVERFSNNELLTKLVEQDEKNTSDMKSFLDNQVAFQKESLEIQKSLVDILKNHYTNN